MNSVTRQREPVTLEEDAALTVRQRRWSKPRNAYERKILKRLMYWYIAVTMLLFFPMAGALVAYVMVDFALLAAWLSGYLIWYRRRTPRAAWLGQEPSGTAALPDVSPDRIPSTREWATAAVINAAVTLALIGLLLTDIIGVPAFVALYAAWFVFVMICRVRRARTRRHNARAKPSRLGRLSV